MRYASLLGALVGLAPAVLAQPQWEPTGGAVSGVTVRSLFAYGDTLLAGTQRDGVFRSDDDGQTWVLSNTGLPEPPSRFAADLAVSDRYVLVGTSDGVYLSEDEGETWDPSTLGVVGWGALALATESNWAYTYVYAGFPNTGFWHSDDGGRTWTYPFSLNAADAVALAGRGASVLGGGLSAVFWSPDRGETFAFVSGLPPESGGYCFSFEEGLDAYVGHGEGVHRSADDGRTWAPFSEGLPPSPYDPDIPTPVNALAVLDGYLYAGTEADGVWRRLIGAVTVMAQPVSPPVVIGPEGGSFGFTVTLANVTDQPQTVQAWTAVAGPIALSPVLGPVTATVNAGATVTRTLTQAVPASAPAGTYAYAVNVGVFPDVVHASAGFPVTKMPAGPSGQPGDESGGWRVNGWGSTASPPSATSLPDGFALGKVYPNPVGSAARFTLEVAEAGHVRVEVLDGLGRRVAVLHDAMLEPGAHPFVLDASALPAGLYVVRAQGGAHGASRRITVVG